MSWSILAICLLNLLVMSGRAFGERETKSTLNRNPLSHFTFKEIGCKGEYDKSVMARLERVCEDCYNLIREPPLMSDCRKECYSSVYFPSCLQVLTYHDEQPKFREIVRKFGGKGFDILPYPKTK